MQIKNLNKAAKRLLKAIKNKEKIILYGDADPDGITSVIILKETIQNLPRPQKLGRGGKAGSDPALVVYFPDREIEGYGLNERALKFLKKEAPALLFLLDCGIGNFKEIEKARKMGFEVIVIDHHEILGRVPGAASIVVDPKQKSDPYPFKALSAAGIVYKLSEVLLNPVRDYQSLAKMQREQISNRVKSQFSQGLKESFLELVAISTLADMMPKEGDNEVFIEQGLQSLEKTFRPGLKAFFDIGAIDPGLNVYKMASKIISALNAGKAKDHLNETYLLLTAADKKEAEKLAEKLVQAALERKERIEAMKEEIEEKLAGKDISFIIFEGGRDWPVTFLGPVASKICQAREKPTFIYSRGKKESVGAVRMPKPLNGVEAMETCSQYLKTYGGHPPAAGFTLANDNLEKFKECLIKYFKEAY